VVATRYRAHGAPRRLVDLSMSAIANNGLVPDIAPCPLCVPTTEVADLFDHLIGAGEQCRRHGEAERSGDQRPPRRNSGDLEHVCSDHWERVRRVAPGFAPANRRSRPSSVSDRTSEQLLAGRLINTACQWATARQSDAALGVVFGRSLVTRSR
jgi:hypothetical protein